MTIQLREPEVNTTMPSSQVNRAAARLERMMPRFLHHDVHKALDAAGALDHVDQGADEQHGQRTMVLPLLAKVFTRP